MGRRDIPIGADVSTKWNVRAFKFGYRYAVTKRERFDVGSLGLFTMEVESGIGVRYRPRRHRDVRCLAAE